MNASDAWAKYNGDLIKKAISINKSFRRIGPLISYSGIAILNIVICYTFGNDVLRNNFVEHLPYALGASFVIGLLLNILYQARSFPKTEGRQQIIIVSILSLVTVIGVLEFFLKQIKFDQFGSLIFLMLVFAFTCHFLWKYTLALYGLGVYGGYYSGDDVNEDAWALGDNRILWLAFFNLLLSLCMILALYFGLQMYQEIQFDSSPIDFINFTTNFTIVSVVFFLALNAVTYFEGTTVGKNYL